MVSVASLFQGYFECFNRHDAEEMIALLSEVVAQNINEGRRENGKVAFRRFKAHMDECYREQITDLTIMTNDNGGGAEFTCSGIYIKTDGPLPKATGQTYSIPAAAFFVVDESKITRVTSYYNLSGWLEAVTNCAT